MVEPLGWRGGLYLKMIAHLLGVDRLVGVVLEKEAREARKGQCQNSREVHGGVEVLEKELDFCFELSRSLLVSRYHCLDKSGIWILFF